MKGEALPKKKREKRKIKSKGGTLTYCFAQY